MNEKKLVGISRQSNHNHREFIQYFFHITYRNVYTGGCWPTAPNIDIKIMLDHIGEA